MMRRFSENQIMDITYEQYGYDKMAFKKEAPRFRKEPIDFKNVKLGEDVIHHPGNILPGTILRGALAVKAKASPLILQLSDTNIYQVSSCFSKEAANLIVSIAGTSGSPANKYFDGWYLYEEFPLKDRKAIHSTNEAPSGIAIDGNGVWVGEGNRLYKMPHNFSSITEITSSSAIPSINGLTSDGTYLYTVQWDSTLGKTRFRKITISGTTYTWQEIAQLNFRVDMMGCWTGKIFIGYDSANYLLREWQMDGTLWRNIPYTEPNFKGALILNGFPYIAIQIGSTASVSLMPVRI
jgi:hypothetical protein